MNARFRTICAALGWTGDTAAAQLGVNPRTVRRWFDPGYPYAIPDAVVESVESAWVAFTDQLGAVLDGAETGSGGQVRITRPRSSSGDAALDAARAQAMLIVLETMGFDVVVEWE